MNQTVSVPPSLMTPTGGKRPEGPRLRGRPVVRIHLLGPMQATTYLGENILPPGRRSRAVLGYLCLAAGEHVPRAELARLLWDRISNPAARTNLRQALHELSASFGDLSKELIITGRDVVRLNVEACWVDALAALALDPAADNVPHRELLALCRGGLLEQLDGASAACDRGLVDARGRVNGRLHALLEAQLGRAEPKSNAARALTRALAGMRERARMLEANARRREQWQAAVRTQAGHPPAAA